MKGMKYGRKYEFSKQIKVKGKWRHINKCI